MHRTINRSTLNKTDLKCPKFATAAPNGERAVFGVLFVLPGFCCVVSESVTTLVVTLHKSHDRTTADVNKQINKITQWSVASQQ